MSARAEPPPPPAGPLRVDLIASFPHYLDHILPIYLALPDDLRGDLYVTSRLQNRLHALGLTPRTIRHASPRSSNPIICAGHGDYRLTGRRPVIFVEHGAGQTYLNLDPRHAAAYSGGPDRDRTVLFICPNPSVAARNLAAYPSARVAVVGCPKLDRFHPPLPFPHIPSPSPTVAITFHADLRISPEASSAFSHFHRALPTLAASYDLLAHAHPRVYRHLVPFYDRYGISHTPDLDRVLSVADVLCVDNSSAGFEFASLGRPVVWLSPPWYRRELVQPPRFWGALILGEHAEHPDDIAPAVARALSPVSPATYDDRMKFLDGVYAYRDGFAARRAADAIVAMMNEAT